MGTVLRPLDDQADHELVSRHQSGDPAAFAELYARHHTRLVRFCDRLVDDTYLAEELAHDAFLRAYTSLAQLNGPRRFYPWIAVIARRLVIDMLRKSARITLEAQVAVGLSVGADEIVVQRLDNAQVLEAMQRVRARHRTVLALRDVHGLSYQEIADHFDLQLSAVAPLVHRARQALRREYLLLTADRVAALSPVFAVLSLLRRLRDRAALASHWLPEPAVIGLPAALAVFASLSLLDGAATAPNSVTFSSPPPAISALSSTDPGSTAAGAAAMSALGQHSPTWHHASFRPPVPAPVPTARAEGPRGFGRAGYGREGREAAQNEARHMPYYFEIGPAGIGWDPDEDRRRIQEFVTQPGGD